MVKLLRNPVTTPPPSPGPSSRFATWDFNLIIDVPLSRKLKEIWLSITEKSLVTLFCGNEYIGRMSLGDPGVSSYKGR